LEVISQLSHVVKWCSDIGIQLLDSNSAGVQVLVGEAGVGFASLLKIWEENFDEVYPQGNLFWFLTGVSKIIQNSWADFPNLLAGELQVKPLCDICAVFHAYVLFNKEYKIN
jgi:hypothetical protein